MTTPTALSKPPLFDPHFLFDAAVFDAQFVQCITYAEQMHLSRRAVEHLDLCLFTRFRQGTPIEDLVTGRAYAVDEIIVRYWKIRLPAETSGIALIAVGGYGRGELHPRSDVDLLILIEKKTRNTVGEAIQQFLNFVWDIGLKPGSSVRSLRECIKLAKKDITVATNLMESRLLVGDIAAHAQLVKFTGPHKIWISRKFFKAKYEEQLARHHKFNDTAYNLEPNVKEGPGGLRDIQMIGWVVKRHFNADHLHDLVTHGFLSKRELRDLLEAQAYLWAVRFALHMVTKRPEDRLLFDLQKELATLFGYQDTHVIAVEQFMQKYYKTVLSLERLNEMLLQLFQEAILLKGKQRKRKQLTPQFYSNFNYLEAASAEIFLHDRFALLEAFLLLQTNPKLKGVRAATIRLIRDHLYLIDDSFRQDARARDLFNQILKQTYGVTQALRRMNRYGVLAAYLPEFARIVGRMQYDLFHAYTVDEHTLFVVRNLRRFTVPKHYHEFPDCSNLIRNMPKPELLYIGGLYHDIAKGRGGDHSELGAVDAERFCLDHGYSEYDANWVSWLVKNHLLMSSTAQRKDISDPLVINEFASKIGDKLHLDCLYLLTVADIRATNPNLWNSWKASLLKELYHTTLNALLRGLDQPLAQQERIDEIRAAARHALHSQKIKDTDIDRVWSTLSPAYFLRYHPEEVEWQTQAILTTPADALPIVLVKEHKRRGATAIFIYTPDRDYLFASICTKLEQLDLNVLDARIATTNNGFAMNTYLVLEAYGEGVITPPHIQQIKHALRDRLLDQDQEQKLQINKRPHHSVRHFEIPTKLLFELDKTGEHTVLKVTTADRPGLLSRIGQTFKECHIRLQGARVATFGLVAEDTFIITDDEGHALISDEKCEQLRQAMLAKLAN